MSGRASEIWRQSSEDQTLGRRKNGSVRRICWSFQENWPHRHFRTRSMEKFFKKAERF